MKTVLERLRFAVFEFILIPNRALVFPAFKGNVFRGALGKTFRNLTCAYRNRDMECKECPIKDKCIYSRVFESHRRGDGSILGNVENAPHPFVLYTPNIDKLEYRGNSKIRFFLTLVGEAIEYIPYFILAFEEMGDRGLGNTRTPFNIDAVLCSGKNIYDAVEKKIDKVFPIFTGTDFLNHRTQTPSIDIQWVTPGRVKFDRRFQKFISFEIIMRNLLRRIQLLTALYCGGPERVDFKDLIALAAGVKSMVSDIHWEQQVRYSYRQDKTIGLGGVMGTLRFKGNIEPFMPYLKLGEYLHVGKSTAYGLGKFTVNDVPNPGSTIGN